MNEQNQVEVDPLDTPVNDIDTSFPLLPASNYQLEVTKAEKVETKGKEGRYNLVVTFKNVTEVTGTKGESIQAGMVQIQRRCSISPTPDYDNRKIAKAVAAIGKGCGTNSTPRQIIDNPETLVGSTGTWKVKLRKETSDFPASNEVGDPVVKE